MSRIPTPATIADAPAAAQPLLAAVQQQLGRVPNLFRLVSNSPAALEAYLGAGAALAKGGLDARLRERIALAVAEVNGCTYCLSAHTALARGVAKLSEAEIAANRRGTSTDPQIDTAVRFAAEVARNRGHVPASTLEAARAAGFTDAQLVEIVLAVALNDFTNFINEAFQTEIDFPKLDQPHAA